MQQEYDAAVYLQPEDVENIAEAMVQTLSDSQLLEDLQTWGLKRAEKFSWQRAAEMTRQLYRQVANGGQDLGEKMEAQVNTYQEQRERA